MNPWYRTIRQSPNRCHAVTGPPRFRFASALHTAATADPREVTMKKYTKPTAKPVDYKTVLRANS
jgi:hypothetical protein